MKKLILIPIFLCAVATGSFAQSVIIPQVMAFQGYVTDGDTAFTDTVGQTIVVVNLYDAATGGNEVWSDTWDTVHVFRGYYTVTLDLSIPAGHWQGANSGFTKQYWLDAIVKGNHLTPKVQLTSAAYSFRAQVADSARAADTANVALNVVAGAPIGSVIAYAGELTPAQEQSLGWYICDGTAISANIYQTYAQLFGSIYGYSNSNDTAVYLPDFRGLFLRGVNGTRADSLADPDDSLRFAFNSGNAGNKVGSIQEDAMLDHAHQAAYYAPGIDPSVANWGDGPILNTENSNPEAFDGGMPEYHPGATSNVGPPISHGLVVYRRSSETRPKNAYVYWIIKVK